MSPKISLLFVYIRLLSLLFTVASRPMRSSSDSTSVKSDQVQEREQPDEESERSCGRGGADECLTRRTLTAHLDYIYTQKNNHP
uniref:Phytosulfokine n=1 Tax=Kalanchoe fedtschenkoi TaxID=63787 RepID=A0A7N0U9Q4_KALFE